MANSNREQIQGNTTNIDYYEVLGVHRQAAEQEIRRAYYQRSQQSHPDRVRGREAEVES